MNKNIKYKILFCEADTGIVLKENGERCLNISNFQKQYLEFDNLEDAISFKDKLLSSFPYGEVSIINGEDVKVFRDEEQLEVYLDEREKVYSWCLNENPLTC